MAEQQVLSSPELTSMIFQWMKSITVKEKEIQVEPRVVPEIPQAWTNIFARLVTVNRAFFQASSDVLWERMCSLVPLLANVLPADRDAGGAVTFPLSYSKSKLTSEVWKRFQIYSSKIKVVYLTQEKLVQLEQGWLVYLLESEGRPKMLLPALQGLYLATGETLPIYIAHNSARTLEWTRADFPCLEPTSATQEQGRAFTMIMSQRAASLTELRMAHTVTQSDIGKICKIQTLTSLRITITHTELDCLSLRQLSCLPRLIKLHIEHNIEGDTTAVALPRIDIQDITAQKFQITHLEQLTVTAQGNAQLSILTALLPATLTSLELLVKEDPFNQQMLSMPRIAAIYANRNPLLTSLILGVPGSLFDREPSFIDQTALLPHRHDLDFINLEPFFDAISALHCLETLKIGYLPFLATDVVLRLLKVAKLLPGLHKLILYPNAVTPEDEDALVKPALSVLEEIAKHNPRLTHLELSCHISRDIPKPPTRSSNHPLRLISIGLDSPIDFDELEGEDHIKLARYLVRLFPEVGIIFYAVDETLEFWCFIGELLAFAQESRAQA